MCDFCKKFDFGSAAIETDKYGTHIKLALASSQYPREAQFNFCPKCGKSREEIVIEQQHLKDNDR